MKVHVGFAAFKQMNWKELLLRFSFGGAMTALTGVIALEFGPVIGGLFLAFPAILPATLTLVEKHEVQKKAHKGMCGIQRGRQAAAADAAGATLGSMGMIVFGLIVWQFAGLYEPWIVLGSATLGWSIVAVLLWVMRKRCPAFKRAVLP